MNVLSPLQRRELKARAHGLRPVVLIGDKGVTATVIAEIDRALLAHELIKVRAGTLERAARELALAEICERTGAQAVQAIGKVMVLWKENLEKRQAAQPAAATPTRSARPGSRSSSPRPGSAPKPGRRRTSR